MLKRLRELGNRREDFAFETTLASRTFAPWLRSLRATGSRRVVLLFLWVPDPEQAIARVRRRVARGGHDVPEVTIRRRYYRGLRNLFELISPLQTNGTC